MRKSETIRKALGITALAYQNCIDAHYQMWCNRYAQLYALPLGKMVADDHLQNWYRDKWMQKVELDFYTDNREYLEAGIKDEQNMQDLFLQYPENLLGVYPKTLFDDLKSRIKTTETPVKQ